MLFAAHAPLQMYRHACVRCVIFWLCDVFSRLDTLQLFIYKTNAQAEMRLCQGMDQIPRACIFLLLKHTSTLA